MRIFSYLIFLIVAVVQHVSSFTTTRNHRFPVKALHMPPRNVPTTTATLSPRHIHSILSMNLFSNTVQTIQTFSSSSLETVTAQALQTPPLVYFLCLFSAGFGVPVSEDALCLFAGTAWPTFPRERKLRLFVALYAGVVLSDAVTFWAGRALRLGMFSSVRGRFDDLLTSTEDTEIVLREDGKMRKRDRLRRKMKQAGDYVGFVIRFSVGTRGPLMLVTGFLGKVCFWKFILGSCAGALITLPLQLWLGYTLGHNHPAAAVGIVGGISTVVLCATLSVAIVSWTTFLVSKLKQQT